MKAVERVIHSMQNNLGEPITIDDMARTAMFSKFHFSRMFQRVTGISPRRFLSALRLQEAKRLLVTSSLTVSDISYRVGYNSIGTFSSRFRTNVGLSPTAYRQVDGYVPPLEEHLPPSWLGRDEQSVVQGRIHCPAESQRGRIVVGLFHKRIAQGWPIRHTTLPAAGEFTLFDVPDGTWHLLARSLDSGLGEEYVATLGPLTVSAGKPARPVDMWLRRKRIFDPPTLLAQLDESMQADRARLPGEHALPGV